MRFTSNGVWSRFTVYNWNISFHRRRLFGTALNWKQVKVEDRPGRLLSSQSEECIFKKWNKSNHNSIHSKNKGKVRKMRLWPLFLTGIWNKMLDVVPYPWRKEEQRRVAVWYTSRDSLLSFVIILNLFYKPLHSQSTVGLPGWHIHC